MNFYQTLIEPVVSIFLPALCIHCHNPLQPGRKVICATCYAQLIPTDAEQTDIFLERLHQRYFGDIFILYRFDALFQQLIHLLKYQRFLVIADYFGQSLAQELSSRKYDLITAVPLNRVRFRERGYNQSALIASHCADTLKTDFDSDILLRERNTASQTKLTRSERIRNVANAFSLNKDVRQKDILIIDDVITTGSTLNECARILKEGQAGRVDVAALATPTAPPQDTLESEEAHLNLF